VSDVKNHLTELAVTVQLVSRKKETTGEKTESFTENIISAPNVAKINFLAMKRCVWTAK
jgi:hypothetical protein